MTPEQHARMAWFNTIGYKPRPLRQVTHGVWIILLPCKLTGNSMPLRLRPDGSYVPPWYDVYKYRKERVQLWQA